MATLTSKLGLRKPADDGSESVNVSADLNGNWDIVDENAGITRCLSTDHPADPYDGMPIKEDDTGLVRIWNADTATWDTVTVPPEVATSTTRPGSPLAGDDLYETDTQAKSLYTGTAWRYVGAPLVATTADAVTVTKFPGLEVFETSTGHKKLWDGTAWRYVHFEPTAWTAFTSGTGGQLQSGFTPHNDAFGYAPAWRFVRPNTVELRGTIVKGDGSGSSTANYFVSGDVVLIVPSTIKPAQIPYHISRSQLKSTSDSFGWSVSLELKNDTGNLVIALKSGTTPYAPGWIALDGFIYDLT